MAKAQIDLGVLSNTHAHAQVVTVKSRFIADNQTDMIIEIKQKGTPDLDEGRLDHRCARRLKPRERCGSVYAVIQAVATAMS